MWHQIAELLISHRKLFNHPTFGAVSRIQVTVSYKSYKAYVLMRQWKYSTFEGVEEIKDLCHTIEEKSSYKFCPGLEMHNYNKRVL